VPAVGSHIDPVLEDVQCTGINAGHSRLAALVVEHADGAALEVHVLRVQVQRLG
jgi:hypothetical protein